MQDNNISDSSDSSDSSSFANNHNDSGSSNIISNLSVYKSDPLKCSSFASKLDAYNNNQLLLPAQFYKTLLAKAVLSSNSDDKANLYKNMLFAKERDFDQVNAAISKNGGTRPAFAKFNKNVFVFYSKKKRSILWNFIYSIWHLCFFSIKI